MFQSHIAYGTFCVVPDRRTDRSTRLKGLPDRLTEPSEAVLDSLRNVLAKPNRPTFMVAGGSDGNRQINCKPPWSVGFSHWIPFTRTPVPCYSSCLSFYGENNILFGYDRSGRTKERNSSPTTSTAFASQLQSPGENGTQLHLDHLKSTGDAMYFMAWWCQLTFTSDSFACNCINLAA